MPLIRSNATELFYEISGPPGAPVIVFSNSIGATLEMWEAQAQALSSRFRCLRYDTRGHGRSPVRDEPVTIDDLAEDLAGLLDALGVAKAHVVGLSLGGMTAQALAARYPAKIDRLVLMATSAYHPTGWDERAALVREKGMAALVDAVMARWFTPGYVAAAPKPLADMRDRFLKIDPRGYAACCFAIRDMDLRPVHAAIKAPTLIVAGAEDPATPVPMMEEIRTRIAGSELVVLSDVAHILAVERAEAVNSYLLAFLDRSQGDVQPRRGGASFEDGLSNRKAVLGAEHVERSLGKAGAWATPWQDFITRMAWGEIWGDPSIPWKTRSMVTLAMMVALHREEEFKLHVRPALRNGVTVLELQSLLLQTSIYAGVPAANAAFRWVKDVLGEEID